MLLQEEIGMMTMREVKNFPLEFKVENTGKYFMEISVNYCSLRFMEQLNRHIEAFPEFDNSKMQSEDHIIDLSRRVVTKK